MISLESDYIKGAHPFLLQRLKETNEEALSGYGSDKYCERAAEKIKAACGRDDAEVFFLTGGTQTNAIVIAAMVPSYAGVLAADTGHISVHEAGAIEYTGHKVLSLPQKEGKVSPEDLQCYLRNFYEDGNREHMVYPGMLYISHPTEYGTLYTKKELTAISEICNKYEIPLYLDGARLGYGLMSYDTDVTLEDVANLCDVFYIGGTKVGALCGEAVVFTKGNQPAHFVTMVKKQGGLLAKGRLLGVQFDALFTDDLYFKISRHAIDMAKMLKDILKKKGYRFYLESPTNQQFIILDNEKMKTLQEQVAFSFWEKYDEKNTVVRFATGWSTTTEELKALETIL